jgi:hypothetical protein
MRDKEKRKNSVVKIAEELGKEIELCSDTLLYNEMLELAVRAIMKPLSIKDADKGIVLRIAVDRAMKEE